MDLGHDGRRVAFLVIVRRFALYPHPVRLIVPVLDILRDGRGDLAGLGKDFKNRLCVGDGADHSEAGLLLGDHKVDGGAFGEAQDGGFMGGKVRHGNI